MKERRIKNGAYEYMKRLILIPILLGLCSIANAQQRIPLTATSTDCSTAGSCLSIYVTNVNGGDTFTISGTYSGTIQFEAAGDGTVTTAPTLWVPLSVTPSNSSTSVTSTTSTGVWQVNITAYTNVRMRLSSLASGAPIVSIVPSNASARGGSGGGGGASGTVSGQANGVIPLGTTATSITQQSHLDDGVTTASTITSTEQIAAPSFATTGSGAGYFQCTAGTTPGVGAGSTIRASCPATATAYEILFPTASSTGLLHATDATNVNTWSISAVTSADATGNTSGSGNFCLVTSCTMVTPTLGVATATSVAVTADGVHSGYANLVGNTANQAVTANTFGFMGPNLATFTAYAIQWPSAAPAANSGICTGAPSSSVSQATFCTAPTFSGQITSGAIGVASGILAMNGTTSGTASFTAPAVAGTATNTIAVTNSLKLPSGTVYGWNADTGLSRDASGVVDVGNGTAGDSSGTLKTNNFKYAGSITNNFSGNLLINAGAPTIAGAGCGGSAASIPNNNGTAAFTINVGTTPTAAGCTITMPAATVAWNCYVTDITTNSTAVSLQKQTGAASTTAVVLQNFSDISVATAPVANDIYRVACFAY